MLELVIEIPRGSFIKSEHESSLYYDRLLQIPMVENYGFINGSSIQEDGDLADFYLISNLKFESNLKIPEDKVILLGVYEYIDKGELDNKYLYCLKQELARNPETFMRTILYKINCIGAYLKHYKNSTNQVSKLYLSKYWDSHTESIKRLDSFVNVEIKDITVG